MGIMKKKTGWSPTKIDRFYCKISVDSYFEETLDSVQMLPV